MTCVHFTKLPPQPPSWRIHPVLFAARTRLIRAKLIAGNISFGLQTSEQLVDAAEVVRRFRGIVFVGDSQVREVAWATAMFLAANRTIALRKHQLPATDGKHGPRPFSVRASTDQCLPHWVGKLGFSATCPEEHGTPCSLTLPFGNRSQEADRMRMWLNSNASATCGWDGQLSAVDERVCEEDGDTFVSYQGTYHDGEPIDPYSIPSCLHDHLEGRHRRTILWVISGSALHQLATCSSIQLRLPQHVLSKFPTSVLRDSVVWQPAGGGFLPQPIPDYCRSRRSSIDAIAAAEKHWLEAENVRYYDYTAISRELAPLMQDGNHFVYYFLPCSTMFPQVAGLLGRLALSHAVGRPLRFCGEAPVNGTCIPDCVGDTCGRMYCWGKGTVYRARDDSTDSGH